MSKIKVLVVPSDRTGVGKFRSVDPHVFLQNLYGDDFHVDIIYEPSYDDMNFWKEYQIVAFHRSIGSDFDRANILIQKLNEMGIITVCDIDDYWMPGKEHPIHDIIRVNKINEKIMANLRVSKYVTTTTTIFADEIKKLNKNVVVFPNAINPNEPQFKEPKQQPQSSVSGIDYKLIKKMINEAVNEALQENGLITESSEKSNEVFSFKVGKHIFEGKVTKIKKLS